jgi:DNA-binding Lrp family transcriptional regulator
MADGGASHIRSTPHPMPSRARLREVLGFAISITEAAKALEVSAARVAAYCRETDDEGIVVAYRACVERGKFKQASRKPPTPSLPRFAVTWSRKDSQQECSRVDRIWTVYAGDEAEALRIAADVTRRPAGELTVTREIAIR